MIVVKCLAQAHILEVKNKFLKPRTIDTSLKPRTHLWREGQRHILEAWSQGHILEAKDTSLKPRTRPEAVTGGIQTYHMTFHFNSYSQQSYHTTLDEIVWNAYKIFLQMTGSQVEGRKHNSLLGTFYSHLLKNEMIHNYEHRNVQITCCHTFSFKDS